MERPEIKPATILGGVVWEKGADYGVGVFVRVEARLLF
jgi:hypothetical protein